MENNDELMWYKNHFFKQDIDRRCEFITRHLEEHRRINLCAIVDAFDVSTPVASADIKRWRARYPNKIEYNGKRRTYVLVGEL